ncbi:hypothetical protein CEUSTIGMA_g1127.t1 [Chlamydomonas eustigma]|uniref:Rubisco LSMT substrate-binding domain-containing protein n=1 Tax=Chlamydomonas eustigma TaxID=1157962 RepID=A0A250WSG3_9CHLO|nr:hypothetical protein CEUSTIGMA_g1127.t1 [Chlamydomonas eustigma]|eukprot:GAX73676.1 hypothetical protein CEUSTIGMA_g1127.t1 [Chlamydomonas eustigma]
MAECLMPQRGSSATAPQVCVRGVAVTKAMPSSSTLLSIPLKCIIKDSDCPAAFPGAPWNVNMAALLLAEISAHYSWQSLGQAGSNEEKEEELIKGSTSTSGSKWWPYFLCLPAIYSSSPLLFEQQQLRDLQYKPAIEAIQVYQRFAREAHEAWSKSQNRGSSDEGSYSGRKHYNWSCMDFFWALHMVQSRSIRVASRGYKALIPGVDLLNHGGTLANGGLGIGRSPWQLSSGSEEEPSSMLFVTNKALSAGEQVLWSYGSRSNDDFLVYHGFCLDENPDEDVILFADLCEVASWVVVELQRLGLLLRSTDQHEKTAVNYSVMTGCKGTSQDSHPSSPSSASRSRDQGHVGAESASAATYRITSEPLSAAFNMLLEIGETVAMDAWHAAGSHCSAIQVPGTCSSLLVGIEAGVRAIGLWMAESHLDASIVSLKDRASRGRIRESLLMNIFKQRDIAITRRLGSFRLHSAEWGTEHCPPCASEMVIRSDGLVDVRLLAVLAASVKQAVHMNRPAEHSAPSGGGSAWPLEDISRSAEEGVVVQLLVRRCWELLIRYPTSLEQDSALLEMSRNGVGGPADIPDANVLKYRMGKKQVLQNVLSTYKLNYCE